MSRHDQLILLTDVKSSGELSGEDIFLRVNLRLRLDEITEVENEQLRTSARREPVAMELRRLAYKIYSERRLRDRIVAEKLFGEPAWDMLLALYSLPARGEMLTVTGLSYAAEIPQATGSRWQKLLTELGFIECGPEGLDGRKKLVRLTASGKDLMHRILTRLYYREVPMAERQG